MGHKSPGIPESMIDSVAAKFDIPRVYQIFIGGVSIGDPLIKISNPYP